MPSTDSQRAQTHLERGRHFFAVGKFEEALEAFEAALACDPELLLAYTGKALAFTQLKRFAAAEDLCRDLVTRAPDFPMAYVAWGSALHHNGKPKEALEKYRQAVALGPGDGLVLYNAACYWGHEGNGRECRRLLQRALALEPRLHRNAAMDPAFAAFHGEPWFEELVAFKK
jgi:tetratricopeptide (TPR) repeat protein